MTGEPSSSESSSREWSSLERSWLQSIQPTIRSCKSERWPWLRSPLCVMDKKGRGSDRHGEKDSLALLLEHQRELRDQLQQCETLIFEKETEYLDSTEYGNIVRGWDGYIDSKLRRDPVSKRSKIPDSDRIFSLSSVSSQVAEPVDTLATGTSHKKKAAGSGASAGASSAQGSTRQRSTRDKRKRKRGYDEEDEEELF